VLIDTVTYSLLIRCPTAVATFVERMIIWTIFTFAALLSLYTSRVGADSIRGVNLGGWLLVEEW
jgi:hypothetical protein